jgi:hypothetical protein
MISKKVNKQDVKRILETAKAMRPNDGFVVRCSNGLTGEGYATIGESRNGRAGVKPQTVLDRIKNLEKKGRLVAEGLTHTPAYRDVLNDNDTGSGTGLKGPGFPSKFPDGTEDNIVYEICQFDRSQLELSQEYFNEFKSRTVCKVRAEYTLHKNDVDTVQLSNITQNFTVPVDISNVAKVKFTKRIA